MKRLGKALVVFLAAFACANAALAYVSPGKPQGFVNDFAKILTADQAATLNTKIGNFERPAGVELAVVTIPSLGDDTIENYAVRLFEEWGIGKERADNGILFLVAPVDRQMRIEVGYGMEGTITDAQAFYIINNDITPLFAQGDYYGGINKGVDQIIGLVEGDPTITAATQQPRKQSRDYGSLIVFGIIVFVNLVSFMARTRSWWFGGVAGAVAGAFVYGLVGAGIGLVAGLLIDFLLSTFASHWFKGPHDKGGPGFWFFGSGGGGGGFGGFGGGSSGGGGASGRW